MSKLKKDLKIDLNLVLQGAITAYQNDFEKQKQLQSKRYSCYMINSEGELCVDSYIEKLNKKIKYLEDQLCSDIAKINNLKKSIKGEKENED